MGLVDEKQYEVIKKIACNAAIVFVVVILFGRDLRPEKEVIVLKEPNMEQSSVVVSQPQELESTDVTNSNELGILGEQVENGNVDKQVEGGVLEEKINLNTATSEQLQTVNGIGPAIAERILSYKSEYGGFLSIEELMNVKGIGEKTFAKLKDNFFVE